MTTTAIISGLIILCIIYAILNRYKPKPKEEFEHQELSSQTGSAATQPNELDTEKLSAESPAETERKEKNRLYREADFINKSCTRLEDFIINEKINAFDLRKLANLNGIDLQISEGWYPLTLELIRELHENGWDKKVSCIKEKYAELRFYTADAYGSNLHMRNTRRNPNPSARRAVPKAKQDPAPAGSMWPAGSITWKTGRAFPLKLWVLPIRELPINGMK